VSGWDRQDAPGKGLEPSEWRGAAVRLILNADIGSSLILRAAFPSPVNGKHPT